MGVFRGIWEEIIRVFRGIWEEIIRVVNVLETRTKVIVSGMIIFTIVASVLMFKVFDNPIIDNWREDRETEQVLKERDKRLEKEKEDRKSKNKKKDLEEKDEEESKGNKEPKF